MNKKLIEWKDQTREDLAAEYGQTLQTLRTEHEQETIFPAMVMVLVIVRG